MFELFFGFWLGGAFMYIGDRWLNSNDEYRKESDWYAIFLCGFLWPLTVGFYEWRK